MDKTPSLINFRMSLPAVTLILAVPFLFLLSPALGQGKGVSADPITVLGPLSNDECGDACFYSADLAPLRVVRWGATGFRSILEIPRLIILHWPLSSLTPASTPRT